MTILTILTILQAFLARRKYPTSPTEAHSATNTMVKPRTKASEWWNATRLALGESAGVVPTM